MQALDKDGRLVQSMRTFVQAMPGAKINYGVCRHLVPVPLPDKLPALTAKVGADSAVDLSWNCSAKLIGLTFEVHRATKPDFTPCEATRIATTS